MRHGARYGWHGVLIPIIFALIPAAALADQGDEELVKKSLNPVAAMISVPLQFNQDYGIGPDDDAKRTWLNVQPVIPFDLSQSMNLIVRTIVPLIDAEATTQGGDDERGLGDTTQSFFFTPKDKVGGWIVGFGPALLYPTASEDELGNKKWGAGPTGVFVWQGGGITCGLLFNHIWSYAGSDSRTDVSATFLQPFFSYTTKTYTTLSLNTESTYDWEESQWTVPINIGVSQMVKIKGLPLTLQLGYRYYAEAPDYGPDWGLRFTTTFLFPK